MTPTVTSIPKQPRPHQFPVDAVYVCVRPQLTIGGVTLRNGDRLPADSPVRQLPRRLETLCRQRILAPVMATPAKETVTEKRPAAATLPSSEGADYDTMSVADLQAVCQQMGLPAHGNRLMLRGRIRKHLA